MKTIILNHKSYLSYEEIQNYKNIIEAQNIENINLVLMPTLAYLSEFKNSKIEIGAQNFYSYNYGSYTGEISLETLKSLNINYTLVGHPERLMLKLDSYQEVKDKFFRSINLGFKTILCVGHNENEKILKKELKFFLNGIEESVLKNLIIAFEPSSKIEGEIVNLKQIQYVYNYIKEYMFKHFEITVPFIYGGSVNKNNIKEILEIT
ncbi:MAG: triosephosphate isomerase, partial [Bacilli bacterium]|nr:triosephosphate isomerase [Bacilli bacterium]